MSKVIDYTEHKLIKMIKNCFYEEDQYCLLTILEMYKKKEVTVRWVSGVPMVDQILEPSMEAVKSEPQRV